jgi:hypothetical protein
MSEPPSPPDHGWTLCEAAAQLFPAEWAAATFPEDNAKARSHPGIAPPDDPLIGIPIERARRIMVLAYARDHGESRAVGGSSADEELLVEAHRAFEAQIAANIAAARKAAEAARHALPRLFAERMQRGDLLAYGVNMAAGIDAPPTLIPPHFWLVARPHFGFDKPTIHYGRPRSYTLPAPEAGIVTGLPRGLTLRGVRIKSAALAASPMPAAAPEILSSGCAAGILAEEAAILARWLASAHPNAPATPPTPAPATPPTPAEIFSTGMPGRPSSKHFIRAEHQRRLDEGEAHESVADEAKHLAAWLAQQHPTAPQPTLKTVMNAIRTAHRQRATRPKIPPRN